MGLTKSVFTWKNEVTAAYTYVTEIMRYRKHAEVFSQAQTVISCLCFVRKWQRNNSVCTMEEKERWFVLLMTLLIKQHCRIGGKNVSLVYVLNYLLSQSVCLQWSTDLPSPSPLLSPGRNKSASEPHTPTSVSEQQDGCLSVKLIHWNVTSLTLHSDH